MPNPTNTFLWRYLAQQDAKRAQEANDARWLADQSMEQDKVASETQDKQYTKDSNRGAVLAQLDEPLPVNTPTTPGMTEGYDVGRLAKQKSDAAMRQALGLQQLKIAGAANVATGRQAAASTIEQQREAAALQRARIMANAMGQRQTNTINHAADLDTQKLSKIMSDYAPMQEDLQHLDRLSRSNKPVSGFGPIEGHIPDMLINEEGGANRRSTGRLINGILKQNSGAAVSDQERVRTLRAQMMSPNVRDDQLRAAIRELVAITQRTMKAKQAGFPPNVVQGYSEQGGVTAENILNSVEDEEAPPPAFE